MFLCSILYTHPITNKIGNKEKFSGFLQVLVSLYTKCDWCYFLARWNIQEMQALWVGNTYQQVFFFTARQPTSIWDNMT